MSAVLKGKLEPTSRALNSSLKQPSTPQRVDRRKSVRFSVQVDCSAYDPKASAPEMTKVTPTSIVPMLSPETLASQSMLDAIEDNGASFITASLLEGKGEEEAEKEDQVSSHSQNQ